MRQLAWLADFPIAHRGLHGAPNSFGQTLVENSLAACQAAIDNGYAIEADLQLSGDGQAMLIHDAVLDRLTEQSGNVRSVSADQLARIYLRNSSETIPRLADLLDLVDGAVPLVIELKYQPGDSTHQLALSAAKIAQAYRGEISFISFDPHLLATLRKCAPQFLRGIIIDHGEKAPTFNPALWFRRLVLRNLLHQPRSKFDFLSCDQQALDLRAVQAQKKRGTQIMSWTIRSQQQATKALQTADQIVFEGFTPR